MRRLGCKPRQYAVQHSAPPLPHAYTSATPRMGTRVAHCDDAGTWNAQYLDYGANARKGSTTRAKVSHRDSKATAPQARYTSSVTMSGVSHQGSLALKKS